MKCLNLSNLQTEWLPDVFGGDRVKYFYVVEHYLPGRIIDEAYPADEERDSFIERNQEVINRYVISV